MNNKCGCNAQFWRVPVMKLCVKKKPEIQNTMGGPSLIHRSNIFNLANKSFVHAPSGFRLGYAASAHVAGTHPFTMLLPCVS